jgi:hypothetical protein
MAGKYDRVVGDISADYGTRKQQVYDNYLATLMREEGISEARARRLLDRAAQRVESPEETLPQPEEDEGGTLGAIVGAGETAGGAIVGAAETVGDIFGGLGRKAMGGTGRVMENFTDDLEALNLDQRKTEKDALSEAFSETVTTNEIVLRQQKNTNGYVEVKGIDGKMHDSFIQAQVTDHLFNNPEKFVVNSSNPKIQKDPNKRRKVLYRLH